MSVFIAEPRQLDAKSGWACKQRVRLGRGVVCFSGTRCAQRAGVGASKILSWSLFWCPFAEDKQAMGPEFLGTRESGSGGQCSRFGRVKGMAGGSQPTHQDGAGVVACIQGSFTRPPTLALLLCCCRLEVHNNFRTGILLRYRRTGQVQLSILSPKTLDSSQELISKKGNVQSCLTSVQIRPLDERALMLQAAAKFMRRFPLTKWLRVIGFS